MSFTVSQWRSYHCCSIWYIPSEKCKPFLYVNDSDQDYLCYWSTSWLFQISGVEKKIPLFISKTVFSVEVSSVVVGKHDTQPFKCKAVDPLSWMKVNKYLKTSGLMFIYPV